MHHPPQIACSSLEMGMDWSLLRLLIWVARGSWEGHEYPDLVPSEKEDHGGACAWDGQLEGQEGGTMQHLWCHVKGFMQISAISHLNSFKWKPSVPTGFITSHFVSKIWNPALVSQIPLLKKWISSISSGAGILVISSVMIQRVLWASLQSPYLPLAHTEIPCNLNNHIVSLFSTLNFFKKLYAIPSQCNTLLQILLYIPYCLLIDWWTDWWIDWYFLHTILFFILLVWIRLSYSEGSHHFSNSFLDPVPQPGW